jgi:erythromycin esterase-like protein
MSETFHTRAHWYEEEIMHSAQMKSAERRHARRQMTVILFRAQPKYWENPLYACTQWRMRNDLLLCGAMHLLQNNVIDRAKPSKVLGMGSNAIAHARLYYGEKEKKTQTHS